MLALICAVLGLLLRRFTRENKKLRKKLLSRENASQEKSGPSLLDYLGRQVDLTRQRLSSSVSPEAVASEDTDINPWELRRYCLSAERDALQFKESSPPYWQALETSLTRYTKRFHSPIPATQEVVSLKNKVNILRERIVKLRDFEQRCVETEAALANANARIAELQLGRGDVSKRQRGDFRHYPSTPLEQASASLERNSQTADYVADKMVEQRQTVLDLREKLRRYQLLLETYAQKTLDPDLKKKLRGKIESLEKELSCSELSAGSLREEIATLKKALQTSNDNVQWTEHTSVMAEENPHSTVLTRNQPGDNRSGDVVYVYEERAEVVESTRSNEVALEHAKAAYARAEKEVKNLMEVGQSQRRLILELEKELIRLREQVENAEGNDDGTLEEKKQALARLEQLYRESEMCVSVLESEVEDLHQRLDQMCDDMAKDKVAFIEALNHAEDSDNVPQESASEDSQEIERLQRELDNLSASLSNAVTAQQNQAAVTRFAKLSLRARNHSELAKELLAAAKQMGLVAAVQVRSELAKVSAADVGKISRQDKANLESIKYNGGQRVTPVKGGVVLVDNRISLFAKESADTGMFARLRENLLSMVTVASLVAEKIEHCIVRDKQKMSLDKLLNNVDKGLANVCVQYKYQTDEANRIVNRLLKELRTSLNSMTLTEIQQSVFEEMLKDCQERMALQFATGMSLDESMQSLHDSLKQSRT